MTIKIEYKLICDWCEKECEDRINYNAEQSGLHRSSRYSSYAPIEFMGDIPTIRLAKHNLWEDEYVKQEIVIRHKSFLHKEEKAFNSKYMLFCSSECHNKWNKCREAKCWK